MKIPGPGIYAQIISMRLAIFPVILLSVSCNLPAADRAYHPPFSDTLTPAVYKEGSWQHFLQHLPVSQGPVVDYQGDPISNQGKAAMIVNYDVGSKDLQQCADALIRLRAEYLFGARRHHDIAFHFTSGHLFSFEAYCNGLRPVVSGNQVSFSPLSASCEPSHAALRKYLDIVYTYAGTISLARELHRTSRIAAGTVIILPGSPGHCTLVTDEATTGSGEKVYKLAEGYTPAQSIYILRSVANPELGVWQPLKAGNTITTASCIFYDYQLGTFE